MIVILMTMNRLNLEIHVRDNYINQFGKILIDFCTTFQCSPLNGNAAGDPDGQYTLESEQGNSVIDYAIVSLDFMSKASLFLEIGYRSESSHMPLHLSISYNPDYCTTKCKTSKKEHRTVFRRDPDKADLFSEAVSSNMFKEKLTEASNLLNESVESATKLFTENSKQPTNGLATARTVLQTIGLIVNARLKSEKPVMAYLDLRKLMTIKTSKFMFRRITVQIYYCREEK